MVEGESRARLRSSVPPKLSPRPVHASDTMFAPLAFLANIASEAMLIVASPAQRPLDSAVLQRHDRFYDVQVRTDSLVDAFTYSSPLSTTRTGTPRRSREYRRKHPAELCMVRLATGTMTLRRGHSLSSRWHAGVSSTAPPL